MPVFRILFWKNYKCHDIFLGASYIKKWNGLMKEKKTY